MSVKKHLLHQAHFIVTVSMIANASFDIATSSSSMHFVIACIAAAVRIFAPMLACLPHRGLSLSYCQRAMFIVKDLITHLGLLYDVVPLTRNYAKKSLAKMHHYRCSF